MALDSVMVMPSVETRMGDLPSGETFSSSGGARCVFGLRECRTSVYSRLYAMLSSSRSQRMRCDCEF